MFEPVHESSTSVVGETDGMERVVRMVRTYCDVRPTLVGVQWRTGRFLGDHRKNGFVCGYSFRRLT